VNWQGDSHGYTGVRITADGRSRQFYGVVRFNKKEVRTRRYATRHQAALAREIMEGVFRAVETTPDIFPTTEAAS
jgi:hypothetical protein